ncbi:PAS domain-containing sensor histidine kinase [Paenisporosarcina cavernae]|uniref:histidine kinase n=1 Tax=Paenisporosarcina cavernae TaxID=2320858 RepID=A0A385YRP7_9BACL|nr:ATP-binding protein [Paenisporosarcina cavernae]AYC29060.1 PAS domain S-box protein [Paenisporosarcina cavernae]
MQLLGNKMYQTFDFLFQDIRDPVAVIGQDLQVKIYNIAAGKEFGDRIKVNKPLRLCKSQQDNMISFIADMKKPEKEICSCSFTDTVNNMDYLIEGIFQSSQEYFVLRFRNKKEVKQNRRVYPFPLSFEAIMNASPSGIIVTAKDGQIIKMNHVVEKLLGIPIAKLSGKSDQLLMRLFPEEKMETFHFFQLLSQHKLAEMTRKYCHPNGQIYYLEFSTHYNEELNSYVTILRDRSSQMKKELDLTHKDSLSTLGEMAASIAHEIRNPLTSLKGFTKLIEDAIHDDGKPYLDIIHSEIERMESILNEFLILSKPKNRSFHFVSISTIVEQIIEFMTPQANMNNVQITYECQNKEADCILGEEAEIKKVFINMIKNAIEVMKSGGHLRVSQKLTEHQQVKLTFQDEGCGMSKEVMEKVFTAFYTTKEQGTGLGLSHAYQTMKEHDGSIEVESEVGKGSAFHLYFPVYQFGKEEMEQNLTKPMTVHSWV